MISPTDIQALRAAWTEGGGKFSAAEGYPEGRALALMVNALPALLDEVERLRTLVEEALRVMLEVVPKDEHGRITDSSWVGRARAALEGRPEVGTMDERHGG